MRQKWTKPNIFRRAWDRVFKILVFTVNIVTYLVMCLGAFKTIYYCFYKPCWEQLIMTIALTVFAIYINLKNPNI